MRNKKRRKQTGEGLPLEVTTQKKIATFMSNKGYEVRREVKTPVGKLDILVVQNVDGVRLVSLIECKRHHDVNSLKSAIGQLRAYSVYYPGAKLILCTEEKTPLSNPSKSLLNNNPDIRLVVL
jgi:hypothetical protein